MLIGIIYVCTHAFTLSQEKMLIVFYLRAWAAWIRIILPFLKLNPSSKKIIVVRTTVFVHWYSRTLYKSGNFMQLCGLHCCCEHFWPFSFFSWISREKFWGYFCFAVLYWDFQCIFFSILQHIILYCSVLCVYNWKYYKDPGVFFCKHTLLQLCVCGIYRGDFNVEFSKL